MKKYKRLFEMDEKEEFFIKRTNYHIGLVKKYLNKIISDDTFNFLDKSILEKECIYHDYKKFEEPEKKSLY